MYKALLDQNDANRSEFRINPKHAVGTTLLGPGFIFDLNRVVQTFHSKNKTKFFSHLKISSFKDKSLRFGQGSWTLTSLHNLYYLRYPIHIIDFIIIDPNVIQHRPEIDKNKCEQLSFPSSINQSDIICSCSQYYHPGDDGRSCVAACPP